MARGKARCPKCGNSIETTGVTANTSVQCVCGQKITSEMMECEHGHKVGQCDNPQCEFRKR